MENTSPGNSINEPQSGSQDGRHPLSRGPNRRKSVSETTEKLSRAKYLGAAMYLAEEGELTEEQRSWIAYQQTKLNEVQLQKAWQFLKLLRRSGKIRSRMAGQLRRVKYSVAVLREIPVAEKRRIGVGYRDKGALRPLHQRREFGERVFWDQDFQYLSMKPLEGRWLTAKEVVALAGSYTMFELAIRAIYGMYSHLPSKP